MTMATKHIARHAPWLLVALALAACGNSGGDDAKPAASGAGAALSTTAPAGSQVAGAGNKAPAGATQAAPAPRPGRSPAPTLAEWNANQKEVTVKGSSALGCETKIVREYLRVSCRGKNDSGGTPTGVVIRKGGRSEAFTYVGTGVATLVVPFVEGIDFTADFSWTDRSHALVLKWPRGAPRPPMVGVFEGAKSPLDGTASQSMSAEKLCACHKMATGATTCDDLIGSPNGDCERTYANDCIKLVQCARGEPGVAPKCQPGFANGPFGFCFKACRSLTDCPSDHGCESGVCIAL